MIVSCPECNGKVSSTVPACPHCGFRMSPEAPEPPDDRVACPYCAEMILPTARQCPHCRRNVDHGKPASPARTTQHPSKGYTSYAVICALLYLLCWPLSLILNILWFNEASNIERETGQAPDGKGCLLATLVVGVILVVIVGLSFMTKASRF